MTHLKVGNRETFWSQLLCSRDVIYRCQQVSIRIFCPLCRESCHCRPGQRRSVIALTLNNLQSYASLKPFAHIQTILRDLCVIQANLWSKLKMSSGDECLISQAIIATPPIFALGSLVLNVTLDPCLNYAPI